MLSDSDVFDNKRILVTGGTGSFGHQIVRRLLDLAPDEIRILSRDEEKQDRMRSEMQGDNLERGGNVSLWIGDVRDPRAVRHAMHDIDIVFHAAALKQVPSSEYAPYEAVLTNIVGGQNVIDAALAENVERVVAVSTDKAVKPVNAMGMTKAIQERLFTVANLRKGSRRTVFSCVRYGNVVGSRGSVVPRFLRQIEEGLDLTVTDPTMTRFLLVLDESIDLVFRAAREAVGGEIYVLKMPAASVLDIAEVMRDALAPNGERSIRVIGVRPGEKQHEVLVSEEEAPRTVVAGDYFVILPATPMHATSAHYGEHEPFGLAEFTSGNTRRLGLEELRDLLQRAGWLSADRRIVHPTFVRAAEDMLDPTLDS